MANLLSLIITVAETDDAVVEGFQTAVGDSDPEHVTAEIVENLIATASVLGMNDPAKFPDGCGSESKECCLFKTGTEFSAEDIRQSRVGNEKKWMFGIDPGLPVLRQASGGDEHVNVRMEATTLTIP